MILVKFSEDDRISTSQEPIIFIVKRGRGDTKEKRPGVPGHLLKDLDWDKEQSAPEIQVLGPGFAPPAGLSLGKGSTHMWFFVERAGCVLERRADGFRTYEKHRWDVPLGQGEQAAGLQGGPVCCLPGKEGLQGFPSRLSEFSPKPLHCTSHHFLFGKNLSMYSFIIYTSMISSISTCFQE